MTATIWRIYMKVTTSLIFLLVTALPATNIFAEESENVMAETAEANDSYLEEMKTACQQEAAGLDNADEYVKNCIDTMKEAFRNN